MIRLAGESAGALCMSSERFVNELKAVKKSVAHRVEAAMAKVNGQAMRPEKLWGTNVFASSSLNSIAPKIVNDKYKVETANSSSGSSSVPPVEGAQLTEDGRFIYTGRFGRSAVIIEDKRKKRPKTQQDGTQQELE